MEATIGISYGLVALRLFAASILGGVLGLEREWSKRPAGLRTHILVAMAAALYTVVSGAAAADAGDPSRVAANVSTGIGFIGAGTIMRHGNVVRGLTTAASLWTSAAIGLACGLGWYPAAVMAAVLGLFVLVVVDWAEDAWIHRRGEVLITLTLSPEAERVAEVTGLLEEAGAIVRQLRHGAVVKGQDEVISLKAELPEELDRAHLIAELKQVEGVKEIE